MPWLIPSGWKDLLYLSNLNDIFKELLTDFRHDLNSWKVWYDHETPELIAIPNEYSDKLKPLQKLALMRCFRPDRVYNSIKLFITEVLGQSLVYISQYISSLSLLSM